MFARILVAIDGSDPSVKALLEAIKLAKDRRADLIVIGTHGRQGVERFFLGSVAEGVARAAPVPVLLVRGTARASVPGPETPGADAGAEVARTYPASSDRT